MKQHEFLMAQLEEKMGAFKRDSKIHKNLHRRMRYVVFGLTAISTILAGVALSFPHLNTVLNLAILIASTTVGVVTSLEGIRKPFELWVHERSTYLAIMDLRREAEFKLDANSPPAELEKFFYRLQGILEASEEKWSGKIVNPQLKPEASVDAPLVKVTG
jgi:Protein of unknown function (DUF4231)